MKERKAIVLAAFLGFAVLLLLYKLWIPIVWGSTDPGTGAAIKEAESTVSGAAVAETVSGAGIAGADDDTEVIADISGKTIVTRFAVPDGYERLRAEKGSFSEFVRTYPLKKAGSPVLLYDGQKKDNQQAHEAVFKLPIEKEDLQQCADSVIRMYAEYFWHSGQYDRVSFQFADGFQAEYTKWQEGFRILPQETQTVWTGGGEPYDPSYKNFKKYIRMVFAYSSTLSMEKETVKTSLRKLQIGDVFLQGGSPGHVVMVVDVCENEEGKKAFLLAQGYMPAQEFHILKNPVHEEDPWYYEEEVSYPFATPEYTFNKGSLRHPVYND